MNGAPPPPPPPPPHGTQSGARGGLPDGNYDIFIIPPHSAGSGFLYLPSLQPHRNSFLAGVGCTLLAVSIWTIVFPVLREWFAKIVASGGMAVIILLVGVGVAGWAWGKTQIEGAFGEGGNGAAPGSSQRSTSGPPPGPEPSTAPPPAPPPQPEPQAPPKPSYSWQRTYGASAGTNSKPAGTGTNASSTAGAKGAWEKGSWERAREETRKREEERRKAEELRKKREEEEKERIRQREKDAAEREAREKREREARERARASVPPPTSSSNPRPKPEYPRPSSPNKRPPQPTAKTATDDDAFSYRPYDNPKKPSYKTSASSIYSESSYAPSHSTARTTPPPSHRGPYKCKDPDKIVIKAVYSFNNTFTKVPVAQLISGMGSVTDGLVLRITTEGLFIDDDVRGVPQREWDVKAWTLKLVEVGHPILDVFLALLLNYHICLFPSMNFR